jgi:rRNA maturation RNase YbeY
VISFNSLLEGFELQNPKEAKIWLREIIQKEHLKLEGEIQYVFTDDAFLSTINKDFLNHDTLTDIITFDTSIEKNVISGEIYISIERIKENAATQHQSFERELARVLVHGILHLIGFNDLTPNEKAVMRTQEDYCLNLLP